MTFRCAVEAKMPPTDATSHSLSIPPVSASPQSQSPFLAGCRIGNKLRSSRPAALFFRSLTSTTGCFTVEMEHDKRI
jgi:hypothetical protein